MATIISHLMLANKNTFSNCIRQIAHCLQDRESFKDLTPFLVNQDPPAEAGQNYNSPQITP